MISLKVFYLTKIYWPFVMLKTHLRGLYKTIHRVLKEKFKKHCRCAYMVKPNLTDVICEHCGGIQKHSRWK
jgi:hypothetical protein